jgi:hypothetical protein
MTSTKNTSSPYPKAKVISSPYNPNPMLKQNKYIPILPKQNS